jgi:hypothetical protein
MIDKRDGDGVRAGALSDSFDGLDILTLRVDGEHGATVDDFTVHDDGAGAASAAIADALGAGEIEAIAQRVAKRDTRLDGEALILTVDFECDGNFAGAHARSGRSQDAGRENAGAERAATDAEAADEAAPGKRSFDERGGFFGIVRVFLGIHQTPSFRTL